VTYLTLLPGGSGNPLKFTREGGSVKKRRRGGAGRNHPEPPLVSIELDPLLWAALQDIAAQQACTVGDLVLEIARASLSVAIRIYIEEFYRAGGDRSR
jgi:hypothetical protein